MFIFIIVSLINRLTVLPFCAGSTTFLYQEFIPHQTLPGTFTMVDRFDTTSWDPFRNRLASHAQTNSFNALIMTSEERHQRSQHENGPQHTATFAHRWRRRLLFFFFFFLLQLAGNLKGPLDCSCNCWKIREQRTGKNATRTETGEQGDAGGGVERCWGILQSNINFAISSIWKDFPLLRR